MWASGAWTAAARGKRSIGHTIIARKPLPTLGLKDFMVLNLNATYSYETA
jgi:hypothetical protein